MNKANFSILIDYAHEPESLSQFLQTLADWRQNGYFDLIIHILSCDGVGRDDWKKAIMGSLSYKYADFTILTTDNYGEKDNPQEIVELLGKDFIEKDELLSKEWLDYHLNLEFDEEKEFKKTKKVKFLLEIDRKIAMKKSLKVAQFLASNYDYLVFKKFNSQLTKGKINDKNDKSFLKGINSTSKWDQISNTISENIENEQNSTKDLGKNWQQKNWKDETENSQIDLETDLQIDLENSLENSLEKEKNYQKIEIMEVKTENLTGNFDQNLDLKTVNLKKNSSKIDQKEEAKEQSKEQILDEDYLEILEDKQLENEQNILSQIGSQILSQNKVSQNQKEVKIEVKIEGKDEIKNKNEEKLEVSNKILNNLQEKLNPNLKQNHSKTEQNLEQGLEQKQREIKVLIVSTGVGCEPFLSQPGGNLKWNEKEIWQEIWQEFEKTL